MLTRVVVRMHRSVLDATTHLFLFDVFLRYLFFVVSLNALAF